MSRLQCRLFTIWHLAALDPNNKRVSLRLLNIVIKLALEKPRKWAWESFHFIFSRVWQQSHISRTGAWWKSSWVPQPWLSLRWQTKLVAFGCHLSIAPLSQTFMQTPPRAWTHRPGEMRRGSVSLSLCLSHTLSLFFSHLRTKHTHSQRHIFIQWKRDYVWSWHWTH